MRAFFGEFTLDCASRQLLRGTAECALEPKAFDLLELLVARHPAAVPKHEIHRLLWPDTFVSDSSLTGLVVQVRQALGDDPRKPQFIRTVHRFGYAFSGGVSSEGLGAARESSLMARVWWEGRSFALVAGENILGRDKRAAACIAAPGISRRHARILLGGGQAMLEDLASKNGTFLHELRLDVPAPLEDGDTFRLGRQSLVYRSATLDQTTRTETLGPYRSD